VTAPNLQRVEDLVAGHEDRALALRLDVTESAQIAEAVRRAEGHFGGIDLSSIAGLAAFPSLGYYCASKFAVEGLSECLAMEVGPLAIKVTLVEASGFRTNWAGTSANEASVEIADYASTAGATRRSLRELSGKQPGDPRAANAIIQVFESPKSPAAPAPRQRRAPNGSGETRSPTSRLRCLARNDRRS
jgi:NAD(P)-dependent dehydrogenase (short-subunit alcohol dehydrogenase family)